MNEVKFCERKTKSPVGFWQSEPAFGGMGGQTRTLSFTEFTKL